MNATATRAKSLPIIVAALFGVIGLSAWRGAPRLATLVRGGSGPPTMVLLHGYRSSAGEWDEFVGTIAAGSGCRFIFPQGPEVLAGHRGEAHGHAWFTMNLESFVPAGGSLPDLSRAIPGGSRRPLRPFEGYWLKQRRKAIGPSWAASLKGRWSRARSRSIRISLSLRSCSCQ